MASPAVVVDAARQLDVGRAVVRFRSGIGLMLVFVMAEVPCRPLCFVLAIAGNRRPGKLEGQKHEQEDGEEAAHGHEF